MQILQPTWNLILARHHPARRRPTSLALQPARRHPRRRVLPLDNGAPRDLRSAVFTYNRASWYVDEVLTQAARYAQAAPRPAAGCTTIQPPAQPAATQPAGTARGTLTALVAVAFACAQIGKPYVWGGNGQPGFDCSGLTRAAYAAAGIEIPRTAQTQYNAGPRLPAGTPPQPGDLLFFGTPAKIHHVAMSLGGTQIIDAPTFGQPVQMQNYRDFPDYTAATRPATTKSRLRAGEGRARSSNRGVSPASASTSNAAVVSVRGPSDQDHRIAPSRRLVTPHRVGVYSLDPARRPPPIGATTPHPGT